MAFYRLLGNTKIDKIRNDSRSARLDRHSDTSQTMATTSSVGSATDDIIPRNTLTSNKTTGNSIVDKILGIPKSLSFQSP